MVLVEVYDKYVTWHIYAVAETSILIAFLVNYNTVHHSFGR